MEVVIIIRLILVLSTIFTLAFVLFQVKLARDDRIWNSEEVYSKDISPGAIEMFVEVYECRVTLYKNKYYCTIHKVFVGRRRYRLIGPFVTKNKAVGYIDNFEHSRLDY